MNNLFAIQRPGLHTGLRLTAVVVLLAAMFLFVVSPAQAQEDVPGAAVASLVNAEGNNVGFGLFVQDGDHVAIHAMVYGMPPGFHGFHLHDVGVCDPPDFESAGPHYNPDEVHHPDHAGDFPSLLVLNSGLGFLSFHTDRFSVDEIVGDDGSALMVHEKPDNFANIPERYGGPDAETLEGGDSGARLACGVVLDPREAEMPEQQTIVEIAAADDRFSTLVTALQAAELVDTLEGDGPFTVFAPTNEAFAALPEGTLDELLLPENKQKLADILLYHVIPDEVSASEVVELSSAQTVLGQEVQIRVEDGRVFINDAEVIMTDIEASNGVIHVIDAVLLPPK